MPLYLLALIVLTNANLVTHQDYAGVWNVVATVSRQTCGRSDADSQTGYTSAYQWIVSESPDGRLTVSVQGQTSYSRLKGDSNGQVVWLEAMRKPSIGTRSDVWIELLRQPNGSLRGIRRVTLTPPNDRQCFVEADVTATQSR